MGTVKELADALTDKLKDIGRHPTIPLPQFRGKKGEDPNDHCMKVEDYFAMFNITTDEDQKKRFLETLFEKARCWASMIKVDEVKSYRYDETETKEEKEKTFKWLFIKRFAKEGRTMHDAFEAWRNLKFDPAKADVEEFMTNIKNLAATLAFNEEAQVMAIKSNMPRDVYGLCMQYDRLDELKKFLIELFENSRMKSAVPFITAEADTSAFSMGEFVNNDIITATSDDIGKLKNEISALQFRVRRMIPSDTRNKPNTKPWKLEVTPPRKEEILGVEGSDKMIQVGETTTAQVQIITITEIEILTEINQETVMEIEDLLGTEAKIMAILVETKKVEAEVEVDLIQAQMSEDQE